MPAHQQARLEEGALRASDGARLPARWWLPASAPTAIVIALHGMNDYRRQFELMGGYFRQHRVAVLAYDQRGFGASPHPGIWPGEENLTSDLADAVRAVRQRYPHTPLYVLGMSMGGAVVVTALAHPGFPPVDGAILVAPALWGGAAMNPFYRASLWSLAHIAPASVLTGRGLHIRPTDNIALLRQMWADPLVLKGARTDSVLGLVRLMDDAHTKIDALHLPFLLLYGQRDEVIPPEAVTSAMNHAPSSGRLAYYPEGYHLLLGDLSREVCYRDLLAWMAHSGHPLPSGGDAYGAKWLAGENALARAPVGISRRGAIVK